MCAKILEIDDRTKAIAFSPPRLSDFAIHEGGNIAAAAVIENPNLSLYCLDDATQHAIFVATSPEVDLTQAPFYYVAQYETAQYLVAIPYEEFFQLADDLPDPENLILVYTVGRSGSTLVSRVFSEVDGLVSFSEPDMLTQCMIVREPDGSRDDELVKVIRSCIRMVCKTHDASTYAIKWRSWMIDLADLIQAAFPAARNIFLYRNAEQWANSWYRILMAGGMDYDAPGMSTPMMDTEREANRIFPLLPKLTAGYEKVANGEIIHLMWLSSMDSYLRQYRKGVPLLAVRYEDLNTQREQVVKAIFEYCGLPTAQVKAGLKAFEQNSQQGTMLEGTAQHSDEAKVTMSAELVSRLHALLQKHDTINTPDFDLPGKLEI